MPLPLQGESQRSSQAGPSQRPSSTQWRGYSTAEAPPAEGGQPPQPDSNTTARQHTASAAPAAAPATAQLVGTAGGAAATAGFYCWLREWRARRDGFGLCLGLVFHIVILKKQWALLPLSHIVFFAAYSAAMAVLLVWRRRQLSSYAAWRELVQAAIQLDIYWNPCHQTLWRLMVSAPPPAPFASWPQLNALLVVPPVVLNTMSIFLVLLPFAHALALPAQLAVQLANVVRVLMGVQEGCTSPLYTHPLTQNFVRGLHSWLGSAFLLLSMGPVQELAPEAHDPDGQCRQVGCFLVLLSGLVLQLVLQASWERRMFVEYCAQQARRRREQQEQQRQHRRQLRQAGAREAAAPAVAEGVEGPAQAPPTALDRCSVWLAGLLAGLAGTPVALPVITILLWDAVAVVLDMLYRT